MVNDAPRFGTPVRVGLAGTRFGQFYAEAIGRHPRFELVAIAARGSERSRMVAEHYGVPLVESLLEAPGGIDLACVAVSSQVMGGPGSEIARELLDHGIHVLMEQPLHHREITECVKIARRNNVSFQVGDLYLRLSRVRQFVSMVKDLSALEPMTCLNLEFSNLVSFPVANLLVELVSGARPCSFEASGRPGSNPFVMVRGQVAGTPLNLVVHNSTDPEVSDADLPVLFEVTAWFPSGRLSLRDPHGPIEWRPTLVLPRQGLIPAGLADDPSPVLATPMTMVCDAASPTITEALSQQWVDAIADDLDFWRTGSERGRAARLQKIFGAAQLWAEMTQSIGMPMPGSRGPSVGISRREVSRAHAKAMSWTDRLARADARMIAEAVDALNQAAELSMVAHLASHHDIESWAGIGEVAESVPVCAATSHIPRRWVKTLMIRGWLEERAGRVRAARPENCDPSFLTARVQEAWELAAELWDYRVGAPEVVTYLRSHVDHLDGLMTGNLQAADLLFVEGRTELAHALYRETLIAEALNRDIAARVSQVAAASDHPLRILEVGAGTGATCDRVLAAIDDLDPRALEEYRYTDISPFFFAEARTRYRNDPRVVMEALDIENPGGFLSDNTGAFDLVIAAGVLNNVSDTAEALGRLAGLLASGGRIIVSEAFEETPLMLITQAFMMRPGTDLRSETDGMFLTHDQWCRTFAAAGVEMLDHWPGDDHPLRPLGQRVYVLAHPAPSHPASTERN